MKAKTAGRPRTTRRPARKSAPCENGQTVTFAYDFGNRSGLFTGVVDQTTSGGGCYVRLPEGGRVFVHYTEIQHVQR